MKLGTEVGRNNVVSIRDTGKQTKSGDFQRAEEVTQALQGFARRFWLASLVQGQEIGPHMTPNEFKAWFDGFTEAFDGRIPTKAQWGRIKERVAEIDDKAVTERIYLDRYLPYLWNTYTTVPVRTFTNGIQLCSSQVSNVAGENVAFNSSQAMLELGRAESKELAA